MAEETEIGKKHRSPRVEGLKERVSGFPKTSGVYLMKNRIDKIIYVGKAKNLRSRVRSYFTEAKDIAPKTKFLVSQIHSIDYLLTPTEVEAFLLEASLIKKHRPKYNIRLKDDKTYPYIRLSVGDEFPRFYLCRKVKKDGSIYFGPYTSGFAVHQTLKFLNQTFLLRDCADSFLNNRKRPCMTHQIGRCKAPCVGLVDKNEYDQDVKAALSFLRGKNVKVMRSLKKEMKQAAKDERFEAAAKLRDSVQSIESILEKQAVVNDTSEKDQDVIGYAGDERGTMVETLHIRQGRVLGSRSHFLPLLDYKADGEDVRDWLTSFVNQYYQDNIIPDEVLLPTAIGNDLIKLLQAVLKERAGRRVGVRFPTDDLGARLLEMSDQNARQHFKDYVVKSKEKQKGLEEIEKKLKLSVLPRRIECFDVSTFQGEETVASQVVFEDGVPAKEHYRRYRIRSVEGQDDFAAMTEVLSRRLAHTEYDVPQLMVVDGGKGQLKMAVEILKELGCESIPVVGLAKARTKRGFQDTEVESTQERFFLPGRQNPVTFRTNSEALHILVGIRDEAHRFAITYHRKLREATSLESELDMVVGLGEKRKADLLKKFNSIDDIRIASVDEIAGVKGFNRVLAERILLQLNEEAD